MNRVAILLGVVGVLFGCEKKPPPAKPSPHYVLGSPYQASGVWHYPRESFDLNETGLAEIMRKPHTPLTADGEVFDMSALTVAHPTLQLPSVARLTNLETGRSVLVRVNDRGTGNPHRLLEVTEHVAAVLGMTGATRVRLEVQPVETHDAVESLGNAPALALTAAPRALIEVADLPPPSGAKGRASLTARAEAAPDAPRAAPAARLSEAVTQGVPQPGQLMVRLSTFNDYHYAALQLARVQSLSPRIVYERQGRSRAARLEIGPLPDIVQAERVLDKALAAGIPDARIVID